MSYSWAFFYWMSKHDKIQKKQKYKYINTYQSDQYRLKKKSVTVSFPFCLFQVTDILVSPKYDDEETTEEEEDSDDTGKKTNALQIIFCFQEGSVSNIYPSCDLRLNIFCLSSTVYECPGLAAATRNGGGLEVRNPFFMDGELQPAATAPVSASGDGVDSKNVGKTLANKKPISQYTDLFHHQEIAGLN